MRRLLFLALVGASLGLSGCRGWWAPHSSGSANADQMVRIPSDHDAGLGVLIAKLHRLGLRIAIPTPWGTSSFNSIDATVKSPAPGTLVPRGSVVNLQIFGVVGLPWERTGHRVVPRVIDLTLGRAMVRISGAGLPWAVRASALPPTPTSHLFRSYCVTSQTPAPGVGVITREGGKKIHAVELSAKPC